MVGGQLSPFGSLVLCVPRLVVAFDGNLVGVIFGLACSINNL